MAKARAVTQRPPLPAPQPRFDPALVAPVAFAGFVTAGRLRAAAQGLGVVDRLCAAEGDELRRLVRELTRPVRRAGGA